jgi:hypothetical protein
MKSLLVLILLFLGFGVYGTFGGNSSSRERTIPHPGDDEGRRQHVRRVLLHLAQERRRSQNRATFPL